jgi:hypothetical protein
LPAHNAQALIEGLVVSHGDQLRRFLLARVRNIADVPDIMQEVYLRMLRVPNVDSIRSPKAYLFTVAQHVLQLVGDLSDRLSMDRLFKSSNVPRDYCSSILGSRTLAARRVWPVG